MTRYKVHRLIAVAMTCLAVALAGGCSKSPGGGKKKHNVLLVTLDTTRADYLSCYGHLEETSANMDALAADGVKFDMAISTSAATPISHASILTGLNQYDHGVRTIFAADEACKLKEGVPTIATMLGSAGWDTGAFLSAFTVSEFYGFDRGFQTFDNGLKVAVDGIFEQKEAGNYAWSVEDNQRRADKTTKRTLEWLKTAKRPFFTWVHYWDPHDPALVPPKKVLDLFIRPGQTQEERFRSVYQAEIYYMDMQFGKLIKYLKDNNLYDDTIIIVVADHGEGLGDHNWWFHRILYQEQIRVPLIARVPGWPKGKVVSDCVRTTDIVPTILDAVGVTAPAPMEGIGMLPVVEGKEQKPRMAYADAINIYDLNANPKMLETRPLDGLLHCATDGTWKLIHRPKHEDQSELYNLKEDPYEQRNLYGQHQEQVDRLEVALARFNGFAPEGGWGKGVSDSAMERLKALGYVGGDTDEPPPPKRPTTKPTPSSQP